LSCLGLTCRTAKPATLFASDLFGLECWLFKGPAYYQMNLANLPHPKPVKGEGRHNTRLVAKPCERPTFIKFARCGC
jgi:hypothetical protein